LKAYEEAEAVGESYEELFNTFLYEDDKLIEEVLAADRTAFSDEGNYSSDPR